MTKQIKEIKESLPNITGSIKDVILSGCFKPTEEFIDKQKAKSKIINSNGTCKDLNKQNKQNKIKDNKKKGYR